MFKFMQYFIPIFLLMNSWNVSAQDQPKPYIFDLTLMFSDANNDVPLSNLNIVVEDVASSWVNEYGSVGFNSTALGEYKTDNNGFVRIILPKVVDRIAVVTTKQDDDNSCIGEGTIIFDSSYYKWPDGSKMDVLPDPIIHHKELSVTGGELKLSTSDILFDFDRDEIKLDEGNTKETLHGIAVFLNKYQIIYPCSDFEIRGYTSKDSEGAEQHDLDLSEKRAKAVYDYIDNTYDFLKMDKISYKGATCKIMFFHEYA